MQDRASPTNQPGTRNQRNIRGNYSPRHPQNNDSVARAVEEFSRVSYGNSNVICLRFLEVVIATLVFGFSLVDKPQTTAFRFQLWNALIVLLFIIVLFGVDIGLAACTPNSSSNNYNLCISRFNAIELFFNLIMSMFTLAAACACTAVLGLWGARSDAILKLCDNYTGRSTMAIIAATSLNYILCILLIISFYVQCQAYFKAYRMLAQHQTKKQGDTQNKENQSTAHQPRKRKIQVSKSEELKYQITLRSDSRVFAFIMLLIRFVQLIFAVVSWGMLLPQDSNSFEVEANVTSSQGRRLLQDVLPSPQSPVIVPLEEQIQQSNMSPEAYLVTPEYNNNTNFSESPTSEGLDSLEETVPLVSGGPAKPYVEIVLENDTFYGSNITSQDTPEPAPPPEQENVTTPSNDTSYGDLDVLTIVHQFTALTYVWVIGISATILCGIFMFWELGRAWQICGCYADTRVGHTFANFIFDSLGLVLTWTAGCAGAGITTLPDCVFGEQFSHELVEDQRVLMEVSVAFMFLLCVAFFPSWFLSFHAYKEWQLIIEGIMPLSVSRDVQLNPQMSPPMPPVISSRTRTFTGF